MKGGSFKLNMHPKAFFDEKPYTTDKPLPPAKKSPPPKPITAAFKPSHPAKKVRTAANYEISDPRQRHPVIGRNSKQKTH